MRLGFWRSPLIPTSVSAIAPQIGILAIAPHLTSIECDRPSDWVCCNWRSPLKSRWVAGEEAIALLFQSFSLGIVRGDVVRLAIALGIKSV